MIGEWSLDTSSPHAPTEIGEERRQYYRTIGEAQAWEPAVPWTYWAYKHLADTPASDAWDLGKSFELGFLPTDIRTLG
jgi:hypothetical protein